MTTALLFALLFSWLGNPWAQKRLRQFIHLLEKPTPTQWILLVCGIAFLLRVGWALFHPFIFPRTTFTSDRFYQTLALNLLLKKGFSIAGGATAAYPPAYPFFLSIIYFIFGVNNEVVAHLGTVLLSTGIVLVSYLLMRHLMSELIARFCSLLLALSWQQFFYADRLIPESLFSLAVLGVLYFSIFKHRQFFLFCIGFASFCLAWALGVYGYVGIPAMVAIGSLLFLVLIARFRPTLRETMGLGLFLGLGLFVRPTMILYPLVLIYIFFLINHSWSKALKKGFLVALVMILTVFPWILRNTLIFKTPTFILSQAGLCLWEFNAPLFKTLDPEFERFSFYDSQITFMQSIPVLTEKEPDPRLVLDGNESQIDKMLGERARQYLKVSLIQNPSQTILFFIKKAITFFCGSSGHSAEFLFRNYLWPYEKPWQWNTYFWLQLLNQFFYNCFFALALIGLGDVIRSRGDLKGLIPMVIILYFLLLHLPFSPMDRYRFPIWPFVFAYVSCGLIKLSEREKSSTP